MKQLKVILFLVYPILIILLCLSNCNGCKDRIETAEQVDTLRPRPVLVDTVRLIIEPVDTANAVEQAQQIGHSGHLKVTLLWNFQGDIDLHVTQPNGSTIYYDNKIDLSTGGNLDRDNKAGGNGSAENIYWENPPQGEYKVSLVYYQPSVDTQVAESGTWHRDIW